MSSLGASSPAVANLKVFVRLNGQDLTLSQFTSLVNRWVAVRDILKHLGLD